MHVLSSCVFIHLSVSLSISLCDTNHLSACPQICPARARRTSMFWATRKQSCPFLFGDIATILLTATSGDTESYYTGTKNISEAKLFPFTVKEGKRKKEKKLGHERKLQMGCVIFVAAFTEVWEFWFLEKWDRMTFTGWSCLIDRH